jgi:dihydroflavonol-4-reductase
MILVTGSTGHIGNVLVRELLKRGEKVRTLVLPRDDLTPLLGLDVELFLGDVLDSTSVMRAMNGVQDIFHLAGMISIMPGRDQMMRRVNVEGTRNILQCAQKSAIRRLVYTSSIHALQRVPHGIVIDENIPFDPTNAISDYDQSKAEASLAVIEAAQDGLDAVLACPTGVIGPYDYKGSEMGQLVFDCLQKKPQLYIDGAYDFVDVRDVVSGLIAANEKGRTGETYILSGEQLSVKHLMEMIWEITGKRFMQMKVPLELARFIANFTPTYYRIARKKPRITPYALETITSNSVITHKKASRELGYSPRSLYESLVDTIQWFLEDRSLLGVST